MYLKSSSLLLLSGICINLKNILIIVLLILSLLLGLYFIFSGHVLLGNFVGYLCLIIAGLIEKYWIVDETMSNIKKILSFIIRYGLLFAGLIMLIIGVAFGESVTWSYAGIILFSWGLAVLAFKISRDSAKSLESQSNVQFLQVINMVEDARAYFIGGRYKPDLFGWKTHSFVQMAVELLKIDKKKECIEPEFQDLLFHYFNISFIHLFKYPKWKKEKNSVDTGINNFTKAYAMLEDYYNKTRKNELNEFIKKESKIDYNNFYKRVGEIKNTKSYGIL